MKEVAYDWRVNVKVIVGFINIPLADFFMDKTAP
jgi:hypothetical protein